MLQFFCRSSLTNCRLRKLRGKFQFPFLAHLIHEIIFSLKCATFAMQTLQHLKSQILDADISSSFNIERKITYKCVAKRETHHDRRRKSWVSKRLLFGEANLVLRFISNPKRKVELHLQLDKVLRVSQIEKTKRESLLIKAFRHWNWLVLLLIFQSIESSLHYETANNNIKFIL